MLAGEFDKSDSNLSPSLEIDCHSVPKQPLQQPFLSLNFKQMLHLFSPFLLCSSVLFHQFLWLTHYCKLDTISLPLLVILLLNQTIIWHFLTTHVRLDATEAVQPRIDVLSPSWLFGTVEVEQALHCAFKWRSAGDQLGPGSWAHLSERCSDREEVLGTSRRTICSSVEVPWHLRGL